MKRFAFILALLLCGNTFASAFAAPKLPKNIVLAFNKTSPGRKLQVKATDYYFKEIVRVSPDGKYVARLVVGDGEVGYITVYRRVGAHNVFTKRYTVSQTFENVNSGIWLPRFPHRLVVTMGGADYGAGGIVFWTGSRKARFLRRAKDENSEGFNALGVSRDGRILYYEHFGKNSPDPYFKRNVLLKMRLPK